MIRNKKIIAQFAGLLFVLIAFGLVMQFKVGEMLNTTLERAIARQTMYMSVVAEEKIAQELTELHFAANYLEAHPGHEAEVNILAGLERADRSVKVGLLRLKGNAIIGKMLSKDEFTRLPMASRGSDVVDYCAGRGLLFAVPVMDGGNVRAIVYRLYLDSLLTEMFGRIEYSSSNRLLIQERDGPIVMPYKDYGDDDKRFFADPQIREGYGRVRERLKTHRAAAVYCECERGKFFLFGTDLPQTSCSLIGYVSRDAVAGNISRTNTMIIVLISLILLLFLIASIYISFVNRRAERADEFERLKIQADQANQAKSSFLALMSHELRTPLNAVIGMNEMILRECRDPNVLRYAQNASSAGEALLSLINDILDFSKIEAGKMEFVEEKFRLDALIKNLVTMIKPRAEKKHLTFTVRVQPDLPNELFGDAVRIRQIATNLLTNAVKYTPTGGITLGVYLEHRVVDKIVLTISVRDTGIGIKPEDKEKLFDEFKRLDVQKNKNIEGTGLGLSITYRLLQILDGRISVDSEYGRGSEFRVYLPLKVLNDAPIGNIDVEHTESMKRYQAKFIAPDAKILVVDDNEMNLTVVVSLLKDTRVRIDTADGGEEALQKMAAEKYDVIFLDQMMPHMDGIETLKRARVMPDNKSASAPIIVLTANAVSGAREKFLAASFTDYLVKPIIPAVLEDMLMKYLPSEKIKPPSTATDEESVAAVERNYDNLNVELGLMYCAGKVDVYRNILKVFCAQKTSEQAKMRAALEREDWLEYTTFVHGLKSTALSIGGEKTSEAARALERSGKILLSEHSTAVEKKEAATHIKEQHPIVMELYDRLVADGRQYLKD